MSKVNKNEGDSGSHEPVFRTPPLAQNSQFAPQQQQQFYYYYPPQLDQQSGLPLPPSPATQRQLNIQGNHLMSPPQFNHMPLSPQQPNYQSKKNMNNKDHPLGGLHLQQAYYYPQQPGMYQYSPQTKYYPNYSPNKNNYKASPHKNSNHQSPRNQKISKGSKSGNNNNNNFSPLKSPVKSTKFNTSPHKSNQDISRMAPLTSNTNIKKKFMKLELNSYTDFLNKLDLNDDANNNLQHELVTKINTLNCLQGNCLKLLKEPVFDILYVLKANEFFNKEVNKSVSVNKNKESKKRKIINLLTADVGMDSRQDQSKTSINIDTFVNSLDKKTNISFEDVLEVINSLDAPVEDTNQQNNNQENEDNITTAETNDVSLANTTSTSGRMVVLDKNTNFFVSSRNSNINKPKNNDRFTQQQQRQETTSMKRTLKSSNNFLTSETKERSVDIKESKGSKDLFGDVREMSLLKSSGSSNFNKLIETSPKKLMSQEKGRLGTLETPSQTSLRSTRNLLSKNNLVLKYDLTDQECRDGEEDSIEEEDSFFVENASGIEIDDSSFITSNNKKPRAHNKKLKNLQNISLNNSNSNNANNVSAMDFSFDGKAMNKSDLFKLIDSFEL